MQQFKGTPGPWYPINYAGYWNIMDGDNYGADDTTDSDAVGDEKAKANAYLQAAAPDMLEALFMIIGEYVIYAEDGIEINESGARIYHICKSTIDKALNQEV